MCLDVRTTLSFTSFFFPMCCTKIYCTCWDKGVKHESPSAKGFSRYPHWNSTTSKRVYCVLTTQTQFLISYNVVFDESFFSELAYTLQIYSEEIAIFLQFHTYHMLHLHSENWQYNHVCTV